MAEITQDRHARTWSLFLLCANLVSAAVYIQQASKSWSIPEEHCQIPVSGEPFVWFAAILPVVVTFLLLNAFWIVIFIRRRRKTDLPFFAAAALGWLVAIYIDFQHHC